MGLLWLYAITIFLSAALLFSVQPLFAKMVLPLLGGTPAVWNTCMVFFQAMLLAGYGYAHLSTTWLGDRRQPLLHLLVIIVPLSLLPIAVPAGWVPPDQGTPAFWLLLLLTVSVGAPFFALSATTPLLQNWFASTGHPSAKDPYFLYAASNLGSMLALVCYPILIEPNLRLGEQSWLWACTYGVLAALLITCAGILWVSRRTAAGQPQAADESAARVTGSESRTSDGVTARRRFYWVGLAFVPSSWMLGVTTFLSTDVAPTPLLWVIPLAIYLLTFILVFARKPPVPHSWMVRLFPFGVLLVVVSVIIDGNWQILLIHLLVFFVGSMVCHGDLARDRPSTSHLTEYYLWMSVGGVLGGVFNALLAPLVFPWLLEYPLTVLLACWLRPRLHVHQQLTAKDKRLALAFLAVFLLLIFVFYSQMGFRGSGLVVAGVLCAIPVLVVFYLLDRPRWFALGIGLILLTAKILPGFDGQLVYSERSFFGVHRVINDPQGIRWLFHGTTMHGIQSRNPALSCEPLAYYSRTGPLGQVFDAFDGLEAKKRVALVGLGTGAAICYQRPGQQFTFYELDPTVERVAESPEFFTYLSHCGSGDYQIVLGDGRLKLSKAPDKHYGMMLFDAFSSDAIPVHMLTREAFGMYLNKLTDDGVLVFHITNSHVDLEPVLAELAADAGLVCLICRDRSVSDAQIAAGRANSTYAALARKLAHLKGLAANPNWRESTAKPTGQLWTDDFSNIVEILKWW